MSRLVPEKKEPVEPPRKTPAARKKPKPEPTIEVPASIQGASIKEKVKFVCTTLPKIFTYMDVINRFKEIFGGFEASWMTVERYLRKISEPRNRTSFLVRVDEAEFTIRTVD